MIDKGTKLLETDRLLLDKGTANDVKKVYEYDSRYLKFNDEDNQFRKTAKEELEGWLDDPESYYTLDRYEWYLYLKSTKEPVGIITADRVKKEYNQTSIELSYNVHPKYWGNGYTVEALTTIIPYLLYEVGYDTIRCIHAVKNDKSKRVVEKLGFKFDKITKDGDYNSIIDKQVDTYDYIINKQIWEDRNNQKWKQR